MAKYHYKAINAQGKVIEGSVEAANESDLEYRMANMELDLIRFKTDQASLLSFKSRKLDRKELITFTFHLEQLVKAGVPIIEALIDLRDSSDNPMLRDVIGSLVENIGSGKTFSQALAMHPKIFSNTFVSMSEVGEKTGRLSEVLGDLAEMIRWQDELSAKARKMSIYPSFVIVVVLLVMAFLMLYLVPQLEPLMKLTEKEPPIYTKALMATSEFLQEYWYVALILPFIILIALKIMLKGSYKARIAYDKFKLKVWLFGPIAYKIKMARFSNYFAMMYASGISVLDAINMSKRVMDNIVLEEALDLAHSQITEGETISDAFANAGLFSALIVRMLRVGESTGAMSESLKNVSYFYDREVKETIETIEPAIMPVITVVMGLLIAWVGMSVLGPIYDTVVEVSAF